MATVANVLCVERRPASEAEFEAALKRILSVPGDYDGDEIVRILGGPSYGFEVKAPDGQFSCLAFLTKIMREDPRLEIGLIHERGKAKLVILNHKPPA